MTKSEKKRESILIQSLTKACEAIKEELHGFEWLTHSIGKQKDFPRSLKIFCVFSTNELMLLAKQPEHNKRLLNVICTELNKVGIALNEPKRHVFYDNQQACDYEHQGNWNKRLQTGH